MLIDSPNTVNYIHKKFDIIHMLICLCGDTNISRTNPQDRIHCRQLHMHYRQVTSLFYTVSTSHPLKVSRMGIKVSMIHRAFTSTAHIQAFLLENWSGLVNNLADAYSYTFTLCARLNVCTLLDQMHKPSANKKVKTYYLALQLTPFGRLFCRLNRTHDTSDFSQCLSRKTSL